MTRLAAIALAVAGCRGSDLHSPSVRSVDELAAESFQGCARLRRRRHQGGHGNVVHCDNTADPPTRLSNLACTP